jgi:hypothetical protein
LLALQRVFFACGSVEVLSFSFDVAALPQHQTKGTAFRSAEAI